MKDDLPRFPTPMEAFGQGKRKHTSAAYDAVGEVPKPPPQQRYRQKMSSSPGPGTPVSSAAPQGNPYYASQAPLAQSAPATPSHGYASVHPASVHPASVHAAGVHHTMGLNGTVPAPQPPYQMAPQQAPQQAPQPPYQMAPQQAPQPHYQMAPSQAPMMPAAAAAVAQGYVPRVGTAPPGPGAGAGAYSPHGSTRLPSNPMAYTSYAGPSPPRSRDEPRRERREPARSRPEPNDLADLRSLFDEVDRKKNGYLTERELSKALVNGDYTLFDAHTVRLMMKMFDRDGDGAIYFAEFGQLWKYLHEWRQVFDRFDTSGNDTIDPDEFSRALAAFGYSLSAPCVQFMFHAGSKLNRQGVREMPFDLFVQTCISIKSITDTFKRYDTDRDGFVTMSFEDFLTETTKLH